MDLYKRVKLFFSTAKGRDVLLYLLFVVVSFVFWAILTLGNSIQNHYKVQLQIEGIPQGVTLISDYPKTFDVSVKDSGYAFLKYMVGDSPTVSVNFSNYSDGEGRLSVSKQEIEGILHELFGADASIETFSPEVLSIRYTTLPGRKVPVRILGDFTTDIQYVVNGKVNVIPDSVVIYSDQENLNMVESVSTNPLKRHGLKDTLSMKVALRKMEDVRMLPDSVVVTVPVEPLVSKSQEVPVTAVNCPPGVRIVAFPSRVQVSFLVPLSFYDSSLNVRPNVYVDYRDIVSGRDKLPLRFSPAENMQNIELAVDSVEYILE